MCCVCESSDSISPHSADPEFFNAYAQIEDGPRVSDFVIYDAASSDEVRFQIRYCPMCGRRLKERGQ